MISVDRAGENLITVAPGANHEIAEPDVAAALRGPRDVLVISAEIPLPAIRLALARARGTRCVLNLAPAPARRRPPSSRTAWTGWWSTSQKRAPSSASRWTAWPARAWPPPGSWPRARATPWSPRARTASLSPGQETASDEVSSFPAFRVKAVDTVGAGDTFVGALAVALAAGVPAPEAVRAAAAAGATAATRPGAQAGMPRPADILAATGLTWP